MPMNAMGELWCHYLFSKIPASVEQFIGLTASGKVALDGLLAVYLAAQI
jgi:hypothetical protein